ncbi:MAG TPA: APC family permease [Gammaproteobacteria bacterium]|nr:APC family permease [Gammaproteobacteria bacterium]
MNTAGPESRHFRKELGWFTLLAMSLGTVIGSGWLLLPGVVAARAGPSSVFAWVIAGVIMLIVCLVYAELGAAWPAPGAVALYPQLSHGSFVGHIAGWAAFVSYVIIPPAEAVAVTRYAAAYVPALTTSSQHLTVLGIGMSIGILALLALLNYVGVRYLGIFQNWVTSLKYIPIVLFIGGILFLAFRGENFSAFGGFAPYGASGLFLGTAGTVFAYVGFRQALDFGAEARNPGRDLPLALVGTVLIAMFTYVLISIVFVGGIHWQGLGQYGVRPGQWHTLSNLPAPLYNLLVAGGLGFIAFLIFLDGIVSPNGPNATNVGSVPRVLYTMAEHRSMPRVFMRLNPRLGTPGWGLFLCFLAEVFFLLLTTGGYAELIAAINVAFMVAYAMGPVSCGGLRIIAPRVPRPYRLPAARVLSPLAFVFASLLLFWSKWPLTGETLAVLFVGVLVYVGYGLAGRVEMRTVRYGYWIIVYLLAMTALSYLGDRHFGGRGVIPFGWDVLAVAVVSLVIYYWGVRQSVQFEREIGSRARADAEQRHAEVRQAGRE